MASSRFATALVVLFLVFDPVVSDAARRVELYEVRYRVADELLAATETVITGAGSVTLDRRTNTLLLVGEAEAVAEALALLARLDRKLETVVLRYATKRVRELETAGFEIEWTTHVGDFRVGRLGPPALPGSTAPDAPDSSIAVRANATPRRFTDAFTGTLRLVEGSRARIETGTSTPFTTVGPNGTSTEFIDATTGFEASARILGDGRIRVDLGSFADRLRPSDGRIATSRASSLLTLTPGETLVVGGLDRSEEDSRQSRLRGASRTAERDATVIVLRADRE